jgi:hypothetical protein
MIQLTDNYAQFIYDQNSIDDEILLELEQDKVFNETVIVDESFKVLKRPEIVILAKRYKQPVQYMVYKNLSDEYILNLHSSNYFYSIIETIKNNSGLPARLIAMCLLNSYSYNTFVSNEFYAGELYADLENLQENSKYYGDLFVFIKSIKDNLKLSNIEIEKLFFNFTTFATSLFSVEKLENLQPDSLEEVMEINEIVVKEGMKTAIQMLNYWSIIKLPKMKKFHLMEVDDLDKKVNTLLENEDLNKLLLVTTETNYDELFDKALDQHDKDFFELIAKVKNLKESELQNK